METAKQIENGEKECENAKKKIGPKTNRLSLWERRSKKLRDGNTIKTARQKGIVKKPDEDAGGRRKP